MEAVLAEAAGERAGLTYLIELTRPGLAASGIRDIERRIERACEEMSSRGRMIRHLGPVESEADRLVVEIDAPSADLAAAMASRAGVAFDRVVESIRLGSTRVRGDVCFVGARGQG